MKKRKAKFKKGAASFYVVAFSTLILIVLATSFAAVIISEVTRTSNDDLAQSAYDSALAGIEDAKLAYYNYENCRDNNSTSGTCGYIIDAMKNPSCNMVQTMLGRQSGDVVEVKETNTGDNNMQQAYTCVKLYDLVKDYRSTLSSADMIDVVNARFTSSEIANMITKVRISWYSSENDSNFRFTNFDSGKVQFPSIASGSLAAPPTISLAMMQTGSTFGIDSFEKTENERTNRGMVYLVPVDDESAAEGGSEGNYIGAYKKDKKENYIGASEGFLKSNDKNATNVPFAVKCAKDASSMENDYACSATIEIPKPIGGERSNENFVFVVGLPYGKPMTDFALEFFCDDGTVCNKGYIGDFYGADDAIDVENSSQAYLSGVQILVDSTGRANDLYRRVEARLDNARNDFALSIMGPLEILLDNKSTSTGGMQKELVVTSEYDFFP